MHRARYIGLVLNERGFDRTLAAHTPEVNVVVACTDTFSEHNQGMSTAGAIDAATAVIVRARDAAIPCSATLSASFGCGYEGEVTLAASSTWSNSRRGRARRDCAGRHRGCRSSTAGTGTLRRSCGGAARHAAPDRATCALPQHPQCRARQRAGRRGGRGARDRRQPRRDRWLPLCTTRHGQHPHRGCGVPARAQRLRHWRRPRSPHRRERMAGASARPRHPVAGRQGRPVPARA